jgi:hypothetical protein
MSTSTTYSGNNGTICTSTNPAMETEDAAAGEEADKPKVSTGGFSKKKKKARKLKSNNITFNTKRKKKN